MNLSIVIVNWNSRDLLRASLLSVRATCGGLDPQVIVVDGGSFDGCAEMLAEDFPEVEFVQSSENIGFGRCNNLGFSRVKGEFVLLLNPDTELFPGAVDHMLDTLKRHPNAGIVGARLLNSDGTLQEASIHPLPTPLNTALDSNWLRKRWWAHHCPSSEEPPLEVEAVSGACMLLRSTVFQRVGGFNPVYFMYAEDMDLCLKIRRAGLCVLHDSSAVITHHGGGSSSTCFSKFSTVMIREAVDVYFRTNFDLMTSMRYRFLMAVSATIRVLLLAPAWMLSGREPRLVRKASIMKWWVVLRWVAGRERWAREHFCVKSPTRENFSLRPASSDSPPEESAASGRCG